MKTRTGLFAAVALAVIGAASLAQAGTLTAIPSYVDPNGGTTKVLGINNSGWMTGNINAADGLSSQDFTRDAGGTYSLFSIGGNAFTYGRAISETNVVSGYATSGNLNVAAEYQRTNGGAVTTLTNPNTGNPLHGIAQGTNATGAQVGDYYSAGPLGQNSPILGYVLDGGVLTTLSGPAGATRVAARGIEDNGTVAGWAIIGGFAQGFIFSGGTYTLFTDPAGVGGSTYFEDINNNGLVAGEWTGADGFAHAFQFDSVANIFTDIVVAGATSSQAFGLNDAGDVVITTDISTGAPNNFVYNNAGVPEPATWAMMLTGFFGLGAVLRRRRAALAV
ncbi:PEPxxWA-CTERM sorting domain-containing protein [Phenylobacterium sp.]|uniref:PEPxxWA-CTERM sorting domain-containing protein n=1 Tax=Phenylobacterium sp. TaxID=1871053 RepID=UPI00374D0971